MSDGVLGGRSYSVARSTEKQVNNIVRITSQDAPVTVADPGTERLNNWPRVAQLIPGGAGLGPGPCGTGSHPLRPLEESGQENQGDESGVGSPLAHTEHPFRHRWDRVARFSLRPSRPPRLRNPGSTAGSSPALPAAGSPTTWGAEGARSEPESLSRQALLV